MEKCVESWLQKQMVVIFNFQNSHLLSLFLSKEEVYQVNGQNRPEANLPAVDFHSQPREMPIPKPLNILLSIFLLVYCFLPLLGKFGPRCLSAIRIFFSVLAAIIRGFSRQTACIENREGFAVHSPAWPSDAKGEWLFSSWLAISTRVKKNDIFSVCCYGFSQGWKSLYNTTVYVINQ